MRLKKYQTFGITLLIIFPFLLSILFIYNTSIARSNTSHIPLTATAHIPKIINTPKAAFVALTQHSYPVSPIFQSYYTSNHGEIWLGTPITPEMPTKFGQQQYFQNGILQSSRFGDNPIIVLPVVQRLVEYEAGMPLGVSTGSDTYVDLQNDIGDAALSAPPWWWKSGQDPRIVGIFIAAGTQQTGYYIPALFATFLQQLGNWKLSIGQPITEALQETAMVDNTQHHITVQAFTNALLYSDMDVQGTPAVHIQTSGIDMLSVFGPPSLQIKANVHLWTTSDTVTVYAQPQQANAETTLYSSFPIVYSGKSVWMGGMLWLQIYWTTFNQQHDGWVTAENVTIAQPQNDNVQIEDLGGLDPSLESYVSSQGTNLGVVVYSPDIHRYFVYNPNQGFDVASTFKVPLLVTLLWQDEKQGISLSASDQQLTQTMIEESDNDAATTIYGEVDYDTGVDSMMSALGITGLSINTDMFGYSTISPMAMAQLLSAVRAGQILNASDRAYMYSLMSSIDPTQQEGIGASAPKGSTYMMKDGWIEDGNGWAISTVGIVSYHQHDYVIAVYAHGFSDLSTGWSTVDTVLSKTFAELP